MDPATPVPALIQHGRNCCPWAKEANKKAENAGKAVKAVKAEKADRILLT